MPKLKVAITLERQLVDEVDALVEAREYPNRSQAIEAALADALSRRARTRLASECAKLDPAEERALAEEGLDMDAAALTSQEPRAGFPLTLALTTRGLPKRSWVKISQIRVLSTERIGRRLGRASAEDTARVVEGLNEIVG